MEEALMALLLASASVTALVGNRIDWVRSPQASSYPLVVLSRVSTVDEITYQQVSVLSQSRVQVDVYASTYAETVQIARAIKAALNGAGDGAYGVIDRMFFDTERDGFEEEQSPAEVYRISTDYRIFHRSI